MLLGQAALNALEASLDVREESRSAYWVAEMDSFSINAAGEFEGTALMGNMGAAPDPLRNAVHWVLQLPLRRMGRKHRYFPACQREARAIAKGQNRQFTQDILRQALSVALIRDYLPELPPESVFAVIGDGFGVTTALLRRCFPDNKVIVCNLNKPLLVDLTFARKANPAMKFALVEGGDDMAAALKSEDAHIIGLRADNSALLANAPIGFAINILSMQEMSLPTIGVYFDALRRCPSEQTLFYCANRFRKILHDGSVIAFDDYPWRSEDEVLLDEVCRWSQLTYKKTPPFWIHRDSGEDKAVVHRVVDLHKEAA